jgi:hypothetical protein
MFPNEYRRMCEHLQETLSPDGFRAEIKKARSAVLNRMQKLGVDTSDWAPVDNFCLNPRIAGKVFRDLSLDELRRLIPKLEAIARKPHPVATPQPDPIASTMFYNKIMQLTQNQIPS